MNCAADLVALVSPEALIVGIVIGAVVTAAWWWCCGLFGRRADK